MRIWMPRIAFALALMNSTAANADARKVVARAADILHLRLASTVPRSTAQCNARDLVRREPDFGDGLVAHFTFVVPVDDALGDASEWHMNYDRYPNSYRYDEKKPHPGVIFPKPFPRAGAEFEADDTLVMRNYDELWENLSWVCGMKGGLEIKDVVFYRATAKERHDFPANNAWFSTYANAFEPVSIDRKDQNFLPRPVAGGSFVPDATTPDAHWSIDPDGVVIGKGVNAVFEFEGFDWEGKTRGLIDQGYIMLSVNIAGRSEQVVIDPQIITSLTQVKARAAPLSAMDYYELRLKRVVYYPADGKGIDALVLPEEIRVALHGQIKDLMASYQAEAKIQMERMPDWGEIGSLISNRWQMPPSDPDHPDFSTVFGYPESTFGEIHDLKCVKSNGGFYCDIGITLLSNEGKPKYEQQHLFFVRDAKANYTLNVLIQQDIIAN